MQTFSEVIDKWPSDADFGADIGVDTNHVRVMRSRDSIPSNYWMEVVDSANRRKIDGVTHEILSKLSSLKNNKRTQRLPVDNSSVNQV